MEDTITCNIYTAEKVIKLYKRGMIDFTELRDWVPVYQKAKLITEERALTNFIWDQRNANPGANLD